MFRARLLAVLLSIDLAIVLFVVPGATRASNCITRPQILPRLAGTNGGPPENDDAWRSRLETLESNRLWRKLSSLGAEHSVYSYCWVVPHGLGAARNVSIAENALFQGKDNYGHPLYCPEQRHSLLAQPQYSELDFHFLRSQSENYFRDWGNRANDHSKLPWYFKGMYYFGPPGRIGLRNGNPGYPHVASGPLKIRDPIQNGQVEYINDLVKQGLWNSSNTCRHIENWAKDCMGWDIELSQGVWEECTHSQGRRTAHANYLAAAFGDYNAAFNAIAPENRPPAVFRGTFFDGYWYSDSWIFPNNDPNAIGPHNCTTCTGKFNLHTREGLAQYDEGPPESDKDPYNPWAFTVSMTYPTYVRPLSRGTNSTNAGPYSNWVNQELGDNELKNISNISRNGVLSHWNNYVYSANSEITLGFSPSNHGGEVDGWHTLTERGIHLHYPPENWGASFEPTRMLVSNLTSTHYVLVYV